MPRLPSINHQLHERMEALNVIGESRHQAKAESGTHRTIGIHSYGSYSRIKEVSEGFGNWLRQEHHEIKDICTVGAPTVVEYLAYRMGQKLSPSTLRSDMTSLNKLFNLNLNAKACGLPIKRVSEATRGRGGHRLKNLEPWQNHITIARATGARRESMLRICAADFKELPGGALGVSLWKEKGGKDRFSPVLSSLANDVRRIIQERPEGPLFGSYSARLQSHAFRREYAAELYKELLGDRADRGDYRGYDLEILKQVSRAMGHYRASVVVESYLPARKK